MKSEKSIEIREIIEIIEIKEIGPELEISNTFFFGGFSLAIEFIHCIIICLQILKFIFQDTLRNPDEFPQSFLEGSWEGFWWAFITMTTVGYVCYCMFTLE